MNHNKFTHMVGVGPAGKALVFPQNPIPAGLTPKANRILLRKVSSSYIFIHRLLLQYFALLEGS